MNILRSARLWGFSDTIMYRPAICNVVIDNSWIYGKIRVGAVVGYISNGEVTNCVNYGFVKAYQLGKSDDYQSCAGQTLINALNSWVAIFVEM